MRNDRMGMVHALESRTPFLENEMRRFAMNLRAKFKHPVSWGAILSGNKTVVRKAAKKYIPENITLRRKLGFPITPEAYMNLDPGFFQGGILEKCLGLSSRELQSVIVGISGNEKWKLFSTTL